MTPTSAWRLPLYLAAAPASGLEAVPLVDDLLARDGEVPQPVDGLGLQVVGQAGAPVPRQRGKKR